jgi:hypothetical protein
MAKRGITIIGDFAGKKMDENGIDAGDVAKKAAHKVKHLFRRNKHKKSEGKKGGV